MKQRAGIFFQKKAGRGVLGFAAGCINGLFGSGGGMLIVPALRAAGEEQPRAQATALAVMLPLSAGSAVAYALRVGVSAPALWAAAGAAAGGAVGGWLLGKISPLWLGRIFAAVTVLSGIRMLWG